MMTISISKAEKLRTIEFLSDAERKLTDMIDTLTYEEHRLAFCPDEITCMKADLIKLHKKYDRMLNRFL